MADTEIKALLQVSDKIIAEEIKRILEGSGIYSLLHSDNPASSLMNTYFGSATQDDITLKVNAADYENAVKIIEEHGYQDLLV
ncbi:MULTISPECIES: putative signal transducing protein [unclassified Saccharicrinis]|uniref:putative signal transducing protein n=1 Tax=unclassified Saccharicrinis TaxID=2646859 RepID=UPI003D357E2A